MSKYNKRKIQRKTRRNELKAEAAAIRYPSIKSLIGKTVIVMSAMVVLGTFLAVADQVGIALANFLLK